MLKITILTITPTELLKILKQHLENKIEYLSNLNDDKIKTIHLEKESVKEDYQNFSTCGLHLIEEEAPLYQLGAFEPSYKFDVSINEQPLNALPFNVGLKPQCSQEKTYI